MERRRPRLQPVLSLSVFLSGALLAAVYAPRSASAQPSNPTVVALLPDGNALDKLTLVGASAELYRPEAGKWVRRSAGGVSVDVLAAFPAPGGRVYAVGSQSPIFERKEGIWYARPLPNRGATVAARGGVPMLAIGRHIYSLQGSAWKRVTTATNRITALYAADRRRYWVCTENGQILRGSGRGLAAVQSPLQSGDFVVELFGAGNELLALSSSGALLALKQTGASALTPPADLTGFVPQAAGAGPAQSLLIAGVATRGAERENVLVRFDKGVLSRVEPLWVLREGDRFSVLFSAADGSLLVGSRGGDVRVRPPSGSFQAVELAGVAPDDKPRGTPAAAPARTR